MVLCPPTTPDLQQPKSGMPRRTNHAIVPPLPLELVHLIMDVLYNGSSPRDHCRQNQRSYRSWSLVCRSWTPYAQKLLCSIIEITSTPSLHKLATALNAFPHLANYVKMLRVYSQFLHGFNNPFAKLPSALQDRLVNLQELTVLDLFVSVDEADEVWECFEDNQIGTWGGSACPL